MIPEMTIDANGTKSWRANGMLHREDGPAWETVSTVYLPASRQWFVNNKLHRLDGPAVEWANGEKQWWVNGVHTGRDEFHVYVIRFLLSCDERIALILLNEIKNV